MRKAWTLFVLSVLIGGTVLLVSAQDAAAAFHIMRVYGVMGGANGNAAVQYVELRMADPGQNFVSTHDICFFDASGAPYARFTFPADVANGNDEASILVGTPEFDSSWAAGVPDATFSSVTTTAIAAGADVLHPVRTPSGKVSFGSDFATTPAQMCGAMFSVIDSVAYGTGYTGTVNFGTQFNQDLLTAGTQNLKVQGPPPVNSANGTLCFPGSFASNCSVNRNNSVDYALVNTNDAGNQPRNNTGQSGLVSADADGDGFSNDAESGTPACAGAGNDDDADDTLVNDGCPAIGAPETGVQCQDAVDANEEGPPDRINDGCPLQGAFSEAQFKIGTNQLGACGAGADVGPSPSWPADLVSSGASLDKINLTDIASFVAPTRRLNTSPPQANFNSRWDLLPGKVGAAPMISLQDLAAIVAGTTGNPPMFGGAKAFNGPVCTGP